MSISQANLKVEAGSTFSIYLVIFIWSDSHMGGAYNHLSNMSADLASSIILSVV